MTAYTLFLTDYVNIEFNLRRNVITSILAFAMNLALMFISYRLVIMRGGLASIGLWSTLTSWIFLIRFGDIGMTTAVVRFVSLCDARRESERIRAYLDTSLALNGFLFTLLAGIGYLVFSSSIDRVVPGDVVAQETAHMILPLMFTGFVLSNLSGLVLGGLTGLHRGYQVALITIGGALTQLCVVVPTVPHVGLAGLAWGQIVQHAGMIIVGWGLFLVALRRDSGLHRGILPLYVSYVALREMLAFSLKAQFANLINGLFEPISKIFVGRFGGLELLGHYELAYKMVSLPRNAVVAGAQATTPAMTRLMTENLPEARALYQHTRQNLLFRGSPVLIATVLCAPFASWLWLGRLDEQLWVFIAFLAAGFMVNTLGVSAYLLGVASGWLRGNIVSSLVAVFSMVLFCALAAAVLDERGQIAGVTLGLALGGIVNIRLNSWLLEDLR